MCNNCGCGCGGHRHPLGGGCVANGQPIVATLKYVSGYKENGCPAITPVEGFMCEALKNIVTTPLNSCTTGGIGPGYALLTAAFDPVACKFVFGGAPKEYFVTETLFDGGQGFTPGPGVGTDVGPITDITISNPSPCLPMCVLLQVSNPTLRVTSSPTETLQYAAWADLYIDGVKRRASASRFDAYALIPPMPSGDMTLDFGGGVQFYKDTIAPGASKVYGLNRTVFNLGPGTSPSVGVGEAFLAITGHSC